jgi:hypothetical protein
MKKSEILALAFLALAIGMFLPVEIFAATIKGHAELDTAQTYVDIMWKIGVPVAASLVGAWRIIVAVSQNDIQSILLFGLIVGLSWMVPKFIEVVHGQAILIP